ncbi:MAG: beta strand repeat-containing protein, partial [Dolichospermum sp.]
ISNNTFGAVSVTSATATHVLVLNAVNISAAVSSLTISNNTIGNATANNMVAGTLGTTTSASIVLGVCFATLPSTLVCNGNTIQNFTNNGTGTGYTKGIGGTTATNNTSSVNVYNNTVKNITSYGALAGISSGHNAVAGIQITFGLVPRIYNNTISEIVYAGSATTSVISLGIVVAQATTPVIYNNKVYAIRNRGKSVTLTSPSIAAGIAVRSSTTSDSIYNNMVSLGNGDTANAIIIGIWGNHGSTPDPAPAYLYHNSVNVEGTQNSGAMPSFCFHRGDFTATARAAAWIIKNNIFNNTRTGGTTGHFAIGNNFNATGATTGITSNYNIYNATSSATVGYHAAGAKTFAQWQAAFGDANSYTASPVTFTNTAIADLHINMGTSANQIESQGDPTVGIITDVDNDARPGPVGSVNGGGLFVDLGADEFDGSIIYSCLTNATPNTVVATPSSVSCNGSTTVLTLGTAVTTTGNSYQWQYSPDNTNWVNISGATSSSYTATIAALNNYYRCGITCANGGGAVYSTSSGNITGVSPLTAGTYTINSGAATGGTNYNTFTEAFADLACKGISGPIVFNVSGGPFVEQPVLNVVTGSSATNTITINGNGATLSFNSITSATRSGITLNGADYVTIDNLVIDGSAGTYGWGVLLTGGADYNTISNCSITVSTTNITSTNHYCIVVSGSTTSATTSGVNGSYNTFTGNTLVGGYYNIAMAGSSTVSLYNTNNTISNNNASGAYLYSFYCIYQKNATISNNDISRATRTTSSTTAGVYFTTGGGGNLIEKNRIHNMFDAVSATNTNTFYGIYIAADGTLGAENKVINNLIYNITNTNGSQYGIYNSGAAYNQIYHNSIILNGVTSTAGLTYGFYQTTAVAGVDFRNNLIYITRGGSGAKRCVYFATTTSTITSNNNNYYLNAASGTDNAIGNFGTTSYTSLFDWQAVNSNAYDQNSYNLNPQFVDAANNDFTPNAGNMDDKGANLGVTTDILGNSRSASTPDIGAIEFTGAGCTDPPTPGTATSNVTNVCGTANFTLGVSGSSSGPGQTYQWQISADNTNWTDVGTSSVNSSFVTNQASTSYYRVGLTCSGGITAYSTSVLVNTVSLLNGNYTINKNAPASSTNFQSISAAVTAMTCGVTGPVTFNVVAASGPYNEQVTIPVISGASATNTVTFNGNGNTIYNKLGTASARTAITLNGADYVTINNFTINVADSTYGWGVLFTNAADYNVISNCIILTSTTDITSGNDYPIIFSGSTTSPTTSGNNGNYNTISGCTLVGGYYNVSLYGNSGTGLENIGNTFSNNTLTDSYVYSMYVLYQKDLTIKGNNISRPTRTASSTLAGIYLTTSSGGGYLIEKNIIHNMNDLQPTSTSTCYGIFISADATSYTNANKIQNNLIYNLGGNGINYGIYNSGAAFNQIYHNTIVLNDNIATSAATYGIYQTTAADVDIRNNNVYISRSGTGIKRCIHFATTTSTIISNYNNLVMDAITGTDNNVGTFGTTAFATLANWKTANSNAYDQNSLNIIPSFLDIANGNYTPTAVALNNQGINVGVNFDILDSVRSNTTPDIGAYEFDIPTCSGTPIAGTTTTNALTICNGNALHLGLSGNATGIGITYQWQFSTNNINWSNLTTELSAPDFDT